MSDKEKTVNGGYVAWGDVAVKPNQKPKQEGDKKILPTLKLEDGQSYRVRLVHEPFRYYRHFDIIQANSPGKEHDVVWQAGNAPKERYVILILDRKDENQLKLLEGGPQIFSEFKAYYELTEGKKPGGNDGPDWLIKVKVPMRKGKDGKMFKDKRSTEYHVMRDEVAPFTDEEKKYIKENWIDLPELKKATSPELIAEMFEYAKKRSETDPIPGSKLWWEARKANKQNDRVSDKSEKAETPIASEEPEEVPAKKTKPSKAESSEDDFGNLFDDK